MKIYNAFGIKPTNTHVSAGSDYYIPNIKTEKQKKLAIEAFQKSYNVSKEDIDRMIDFIDSYIDSNNGQINIVHLYLAYHNAKLEMMKEASIIKGLKYFIDNFLIYDGDKDVWGIEPQLNDTLFINSGIKIALDTVLEDNSIGPRTKDAIDMIRLLNIGVAGLYVNKSGMGNKGYDVRACLVDEDYAGYVHLSMAFTKDTEKNKNIYCGDKLTQMMLIPIFHTEYVEVNEVEYEKIMSNSNRGDAGFGSSDVKH